jgi:hypothetical protein
MTTDTRLLDKDCVQLFLDSLEPLEPFTVIFQKKDGTQRKLVGCLEEGGTRKDAPPIMTEEGWRSFRLDSVLYIVKGELG